MFKNVIAPVQAWLISRGQCVGCGMQLAKAKDVANTGRAQKVTCQCGRIYMYDSKTTKYRRALFEEV